MMQFPNCWVLPHAHPGQILAVALVTLVGCLSGTAAAAITPDNYEVKTTSPAAGSIQTSPFKINTEVKPAQGSRRFIAKMLVDGHLADKVRYRRSSSKPPFNGTTWVPVSFLTGLSDLGNDSTRHTERFNLQLLVPGQHKLKAVAIDLGDGERVTKEILFRASYSSPYLQAANVQTLLGPLIGVRSLSATGAVLDLFHRKGLAEPPGLIYSGLGDVTSVVIKHASNTIASWTPGGAIEPDIRALSLSYPTIASGQQISVRAASADGKKSVLQLTIP